VGAKILFVDDETDITEFLCYNFTKKGFEVKKANDAFQALDLLEDWIPDILVSDILMPNMDGIALCNQIKSKENLKNIPVVFLSAISDDYKVLNAMNSGADHFISKPVKVDLLLSVITKILENKSTAA
jgi:two-component system, OmpR family, alkaline phosphatase synthesis response regulator PhoP